MRQMNPVEQNSVLMEVWLNTKYSFYKVNRINRIKGETMWEKGGLSLYIKTLTYCTFKYGRIRCNLV